MEQGARQPIYENPRFFPLPAGQAHRESTSLHAQTARHAESARGPGEPGDQARLGPEHVELRRFAERPVSQRLVGNVRARLLLLEIGLRRLLRARRMQVPRQRLRRVFQVRPPPGTVLHRLL